MFCIVFFVELVSFAYLLIQCHCENKTSPLIISVTPPLPPSSSPSAYLSLLPPLPPSSSPSTYLSLLPPLPPSSSSPILLSLLPPLFPSCSPPSFSPPSHTHLHHSATRSLIIHLHSQQCQWAAGHGWEGARSRCKRHRGNNNCMFIHPWRVKAYITTWEDSVSADR